ncbi:unnamed protein product, partial [Effrenium voratum]
VPRASSREAAPSLHGARVEAHARSESPPWQPRSGDTPGRRSVGSTPTSASVMSVALRSPSAPRLASYSFGSMPVAMPASFRCS